MPKVYRHTYYYKGTERETRTYYYDTYKNGKRKRHSTGKTDREAAELVMHRELAEDRPPKAGQANAL